MAMTLNWFCICLISMLCCLIVSREAAATDGSSWTLNYARSIDHQTCSKECRVSIKLCIEKVAKTEPERRGCGKIFVNCYPSCFFSLKEEKAQANAGTCEKYCWTHYGSCTANSLSVGEQFTCWNYKRKCLKDCKSIGASKRSVEMLEKAVRQLLVKNAAEEGQEKREEKTALLHLISLWKNLHQKRTSSKSSVNSVKSNDQRELSLADSALHSLASAADKDSAKLEIRAAAANPSSCEGVCQGFYDACITQVNTVTEHITCVEAKDQCRHWC